MAIFLESLDFSATPMNFRGIGGTGGGGGGPVGAGARASVGRVGAGVGLVRKRNKLRVAAPGAGCSPPRSRSRTSGAPVPWAGAGADRPPGPIDTGGAAGATVLGQNWYASAPTATTPRSTASCCWRCLNTVRPQAVIG